MKDMERERETESMGEMDHAVSGCIMRVKTEAKVWDEIWGLLCTHKAKRYKSAQVEGVRLLRWWPSLSLQMHNSDDLCFGTSMKPC